MSRNLAAAAVLVCTLTFAGTLPAAPSHEIVGSYVEIRSCDIYTGPCFANGEMGLTGEEAIMTWAVDSGAWQGVDLSGLRVIAVVRASATLGDAHHDPLPAKAVLIVDERADAAQRDALAEFARTMGGALTEDIVRIDAAPIHFAIENVAYVADPAHHGHHAAADTGPISTSRATVHAEGFVDIQTRVLTDADKICGNETLFYPPLASVHDARGAYTMVGSFTGDGLGVTFDEGGRRSAYLASFGH